MSSIQAIPTKTISNALNYFVMNGNNCAALPPSGTPRLRKIRSGANLTPSSSRTPSPKKSHRLNNSSSTNNYKKLGDDFPVLSTSHTTTPDDDKTNTIPSNTDNNNYFFPSSPFEESFQNNNNASFINESFASTITPSPDPSPSHATLSTKESTGSSFLRKGKFSNSKKIYDLLHTNAKLKEERLSLLEELHIYSSNTKDFYQEDPSLNININNNDNAIDDSGSTNSDVMRMVYSSPISPDQVIFNSKSEDEKLYDNNRVSPTESDSLSFFSTLEDKNSSQTNQKGSKNKDLKLEAIHALQTMTHKQTQHITYLKNKIEICKKALEEKDCNISNLEALLKSSRKESFIIIRNMKSQEKELEGIRRELIISTQHIDDMSEQKRKDDIAILEYEGMIDEKGQLEYELELSKQNFLECSELLGEKEIEVDEWKDQLAQKEREIMNLKLCRNSNIRKDVITSSKQLDRNDKNEMEDEEKYSIQSLENEIVQKELLSTHVNLSEQIQLVQLLQTHNKTKLSTLSKLQLQIQSIITQKTIQEDEILYLEQTLSNVQSLLQQYQSDTKILGDKLGYMDECVMSNQYYHLCSYLNLQEKNSISDSKYDKFTKAVTLVRELSELTAVQDINLSSSSESVIVLSKQKDIESSSVQQEEQHNKAVVNQQEEQEESLQIKHKISIIQEEQNKLKEDFNALQNEKDHLQINIQTLQETVQDQQTQIYQLQNDNTTLQEEVCTTKEMAGMKGETMEKEMERLRNWARKALEQVKRLEKENAKCRKTIKGLKKQVGEQQQQNIELSSAASVMNSVRSTSPTTITGEGTSEMNNNSIHGGASVSNNSAAGMDVSRHSTTSIDTNSKIEYLRTLNKIEERTLPPSNNSNTNNKEVVLNLQHKNIQLEKELNKFKTAAATIRSELIKTQNTSENKERQLTLDVQKLKQEKDAYEIKITALENQFYEWNDRPKYVDQQQEQPTLVDDTTTCSNFGEHKKNHESLSSQNDKEDRIRILNNQINDLQKELVQLQTNSTKTSSPEITTTNNNEEVIELKAKLAEYLEIIEHLESDIHLFQDDSENIIETLRADVSNLSREKLIITNEKNKQLRFIQQEKIEMEQEFSRRIEELENMLEQQQQQTRKPWHKRSTSNSDESTNIHLETIRTLKLELEEQKEVVQDHEDTIASLRTSSLYNMN